MNPIALIRRLFGLGTLGIAALFAAKSWLDKERAELRLAYYRELAAYHAAATLSGCTSRDAVIDIAMNKGWQVREAAGQCGAAEALRLIPDRATPWVRGAPGFLVGFDTEGCQIALPDDCGE